MSTTVAKFLNTAASKAGVLQPGHSLSGNNLLLWLDAFNNRASNLSADRKLLHFVPDVQYACPALESSEIGPGAAQFDTAGGLYTRPILVESVRSVVGNARRWPLNMCTEQEWAANPRRSTTDPDGPIDFYFGAAIAKATFNFAPKPTGGQIVYVSQWNPLRRFLITEVNFDMEDYYPEEYITPLMIDLAIIRASDFGKSVSRELAASGASSMQTIIEKNQALMRGAAGQSATLQAPSMGTQIPLPRQ